MLARVVWIWSPWRSGDCVAAPGLWLQGLPAVCCDIIVRTEAGICDGIGDLPSTPRTRILEPRVTPRTRGTWPRKRVVCSRYPLGGEVRENKYLDEDDADVPITSPLPSFLRRRHSLKESFVLNTINNQGFVRRFPEYLLLWSYLH